MQRHASVSPSNPLVTFFSANAFPRTLAHPHRHCPRCPGASPSATLKNPGPGSCSSLWPKRPTWHLSLRWALLNGCAVPLKYSLRCTQKLSSEKQVLPYFFPFYLSFYLFCNRTLMLYYFVSFLICSVTSKLEHLTCSIFIDISFTSNKIRSII